VVAHAPVARRYTAKVMGKGGRRHGPNYTYSMAPLPSRLARHIARARLFDAPGGAVVAVSGGVDSVALLDLLHGLAPTLGLTLVVAHADHGIASDSRTVGRSVRALAERYGLPFELGQLRLGPAATETAARAARYAWLREVQRRHDARYLVTAHQQDDQIETILLRLLRGSAPAGLAGIAARPRGGGGLVRPLLPFTKRELAAHAAARGLPVHDDPANRDPRHLRSWVRTVLLPLLTERLGTRVGTDLRRTGRGAALERRAWDRALQHLPGLELHVETRGFDVARAGLARYDDSLSVALLRAAARRAGLVLGVRRARRLVDLARRPSGRRLSLGGEWWAEVAFDRIRVRSRTREVGEVGEVVEVGAGKERGNVQFGEFRVEWSPEPAPDRLARGDWTTWIAGGDWQVRPLRPGDRVVPLGGVGRRQVRRMLMEAQVPRGDRAGYPVVARGETILWVPGICRSAADLPRPGTRAVRVDVTKHGEPQANRRA
jgi:tRNA(Ile)-lysidine synthase